MNPLHNPMRNSAKLGVYTFVVVLGCLMSVEAESLRKDRIAGDSKWLVHIDLDFFRSTKLGQFAAAHLLDKALSEVKEKAKLDLAPLLERIRSVTVYGTDYEDAPDSNGILLVQADGEAIKVLEGLLAAQMLADANVAVTKLEDDSTPLYSVNSELFIGLEPGDVVVLGKSRKQIQKAQAVLSGATKSLKSTQAFSELLPDSKAFFFLAVAEGLSDAKNAPPQAKVLQMAEGGRLMLGETENRIVAELVLKAKEEQVVGQIQAVLLGMIALASLQAENPELQQLVQGIDVRKDRNMITISLKYPLNDALKRFEDEIEKRGRDDEKGGPKARSDQSSN